MIDPILSLSFSMHTNKGVYALLLGSGVSRAAGIPTGWEVTLDLIRKLAHMKGENCEPDPAKWYEETFSEDADYSKLLKLVAKTSSERNQLLRGYFLPTEEEKRQNIKTPTNAHKAIAYLVAKGYVRVIITTNFDRLMEKALDFYGITPVIISTSDSAIGALPIVHTSCTILKVHGDYLDTRIKNTEEELSTYDEHLNNQLDRIFDEFGLIICGWSGDWDSALRDAIQRCKTRRFATYWTIKDGLSELVKTIAESRQAEMIQIQSADLFFTELAEKILAIDEYSQPHPLSVKVASATMKRYLESENKIRIHDLINQEIENLHAKTAIEFFPTERPKFSPDELIRRIKNYEALTETVGTLAITGIYWGDDYVQDLLIKGLERLADCLGDRSSVEYWANLRLYPALIVLYSMGLAAIASGDHKKLAAVLEKPRNKYSIDQNDQYRLLIFDLFPAQYPEQITNKKYWRQAKGKGPGTIPISDHLFEFLEKPISEFIMDRLDYENAFERFEYLFSLVFTDQALQNALTVLEIPIGRFKTRLNTSSHPIANVIDSEIIRDREDWSLLKEGLFGGSLQRLIDAKKKLDSIY